MLIKKLAKGICTICCILLLQTTYAQPQNIFLQTDTLKLDLKQIEKIFLDSNLQLLAQHYNIMSSRALVEQARKWDNPQLSTNQNLYNSDEGFFKHGTITDAQGNQVQQGEIFADVEQLIKTAGKRRKQVDIAKTNVNLAETQFNATMRSLRLTLINDFNTLIQLEGNAELFKENLAVLDRLTTAMQAELKNGDIARKEYLRVQALRISVLQNQTDNANAIEQAEAELRTILRKKGTTYIKPIPTGNETVAMPDIALTRIIDSAKNHNTDYQAEMYQLQLQRQTLKLQKAMAVPDITLGVDFDQHSTYIPNYTGLNIGLPIPLWDRNQGNIKSAKYLVEAEQANMQQLDVKLENDVLNAYKKMYNCVQLNSGSNLQFYKDYADIYKNIVEAFNKRQISMLEFLDYFNDYENTKQQQLQQTYNLQMAKADLNDVVGIDIVK